jgi:F-type H+-transporting ATPase subunit a
VFNSKFKVFFLVLFSLFIGHSPVVAEGTSDNHSENVEFDVVPFIMHHIADAHDWHIADIGGHAVSLPLPVILYTEGALDIFLSSGFHHGESDVVKGDNAYYIEHEHIYERSGKKVIDLSITRNVAAMFLSIAVLCFLFIGLANSYKNGQQVPKGINSFLEPLVLFVRDEVALPNIGEHKYAKFMPYLLTVFFFILINNLLGLVPFFPGGSNLTGNISFTFVLAVCTLIITNINGTKDYWMHMLWMPGVPIPVRLILAPIELIGVLTKPFALMMRLFANITAGHILILSLISLIFMFKTVAVAPVSVAFALFMNCLELLVAFLQAYIFTLLSALFIGTAVAEHEHH